MIAVTKAPNKTVSLPLHPDPLGRRVDDDYIAREIARGAWIPHEVPPSVSGLSRPATILLAKRKTSLIKWAYHGDKETFCPPLWADIAIGSGACGYGCRACFLMLTSRLLRDPLRPVVYDNGEAFDREVGKWLVAESWKVDERGRRPRSKKDSIGLGIDCSDSLLWEGVTGHARRLIPLFTRRETNPLGNPIILLTKSANTHYLDDIPSPALNRDASGEIPNVVISMSLNPDLIADRWEGKYPDTLERITPPISRRLEALRHAQDLGFEVRARIDPILTPPGWEEMYREFFNEMVNVHGLRPTMLTLGTYREKNAQLDTFRGKWGLPPMEWSPETTVGREGTHIHDAGRAETYRRVTEMIGRAFRGTAHLPHVSLCKETHAVRKETNLCNANCNCLVETQRHPRSLLVARGAEAARP